MAGKKKVVAPVYVLTSAHTFSGGDECAYDFQSQKRDTLVGETIGGFWPLKFVGRTCGPNRPRSSSNEFRFSHFDPPRRTRRDTSPKTVRPTASAGTKVTTRLPSGVDHDTTPAVMKAAIDPRRMATTGNLDDRRSP
jgi:hypothetical protein